MKEYPSIDKTPLYGQKVYMFDKIDGSNIRAEWVKKRGFYKYGSRHVLIDSNTPVVGEAISCITQKFLEPINEICHNQRYERIICFFEFAGAHSFAGQHDPTELHSVRLIDANPYKKGILNPDDFLKIFGHLDIASHLYTGNFNKEIEQKIKNNEFEGVTFEGVVCKGKRQKQSQPPVMFKVKTQQWLDKLRDYCNGDVELFKKLE